MCVGHNRVLPSKSYFFNLWDIQSVDNTKLALFFHEALQPTVMVLCKKASFHARLLRFYRPVFWGVWVQLHAIAHQKWSQGVICHVPYDENKNNFSQDALQKALLQHTLYFWGVKFVTCLWFSKDMAWFIKGCSETLWVSSNVETYMRFICNIEVNLHCTLTAHPLSLWWVVLRPQIYKGDPRTCAILIPAWSSNWGYSGFPSTKI